MLTQSTHKKIMKSLKFLPVIFLAGCATAPAPSLSPAPGPEATAPAQVTLTLKDVLTNPDGSYQLLFENGVITNRLRGIFLPTVGTKFCHNRKENTITRGECE